jgi:uncharacterized membrane protein
MESSDFGIWAMLLFWASAAGGIALAISWGKSRNKNPVDKQQIEKSLKIRLQRGELEQDEYDRRIRELNQQPSPKK